MQHDKMRKGGYRWRAGIERRIAGLRRDYGWRKGGYHGPDGMERWLGLGSWEASCVASPSPSTKLPVLICPWSAHLSWE